MSAFKYYMIGVLTASVFFSIYVATTSNVWLGGATMGGGLCVCGFVKTMYNFFDNE